MTSLKSLLLFCLTSSLLLCSGTAFAAGIIQGRVSYQEKGLPGAAVVLYSTAGERIDGTPDYQSDKTADDGSFEIKVAPGQYFMLAHKYADPATPGQEGDVFAYYGGNPIVVGEGETINVGINGAPIQPVTQQYKPGGPGIRGQIFADGKPLPRTRVTLYQDTTTIFRGIGYASVITNDQGKFSFSLEPGDYYVIARKRIGKEKMGPLSAGDFFGFAHANPITVKPDNFTMVSINASTKRVKVKEGGQDITLGGTVKSGSTTISGTILDKQGNPVPNIFAAAYRDSMMTQKPDFISPATKNDGKYTITLSEGGEYYIGARNTWGGPAERGDLLGRFAGNEDHVVNIKTDEKLDGIDVVVEPVE